MNNYMYHKLPGIVITLLVLFLYWLGGGEFTRSVPCACTVGLALAILGITLLEEPQPCPPEEKRLDECWYRKG